MATNTFRPRISESDFELWKEFKTRHKALIEECEHSGIPADKVNHYWYKSEKFSMLVRGKDEGKSYEDLRDDVIAEMRKYAPKYPKVVRQKVKDGHLMVFDPADIHIGKLCSAFETGEEYNSQIAVKRVKEGLQGILNKSHGFNIEEIVVVIGNDILHIDTPANTTTSGTRQDTDGMWYNNFLLGKRLYVDIIEVLMQIAPVRVIYVPSNHDYTNGFFLADTISSWFANCKDVTFDVSIAHRKYYRYGKNLIGLTHGDGAKESNLPLLMANEAKVDWSITDHKYIYAHHEHHKKSKDYMNVCVEVLRSPSGTDSWHHRNGFQFAPKAVEAFIHHPQFGQVARFCHLF
jgi:hypothetical protein